MGIGVTVLCNCFQDGKTTPPPFPHCWFEVDDEGYLNLKGEYDTYENYIKKFAWEQSCCEHEAMDFAYEHISNWSGYRQFQEALGEVGWRHFPVLKEQLPNANGGLTPSTASALALLELDVFVSTSTVGTKTVLVDSATGEGLYDYVASYSGVFIWSGRRGINVGLNESGFFAVDSATGQTAFHTTRLKQFDRYGKEISGDGDHVLWEDLITGEIYEAGIAIPGKQIPWEDGRWEKANGQCRFEYPSRFHVEQRTRSIDDFDDIVRALRVVFEASIETGNPVRWF